MLLGWNMKLLTLVLLALTALPAAWAEGQGQPKSARHAGFAAAEERYSDAPPRPTSDRSNTNMRGSQQRRRTAVAESTTNNARFIGAEKVWNRGTHGTHPTGFGMRF